MEIDEKWPFKVFKGKEYAWGPDNGCFYRWCSMKLGVCVGPVDQKDDHGNKFCHNKKHQPKKD